MPAKLAQRWNFVVAAPPREVFAAMEQMIGTPPYQFQLIDADSAEIVEFQRNSMVGHWRRVDDRRRVLGRTRPAVRNQRWVRCRARVSDVGTLVALEASGGKAPRSRALQLIGVINRGMGDHRTVYRSRHIPPGPVTLVASWAGMPYRLFTAPRRDAARDRDIFTATRMEAVGAGTAEFVPVRLSDGHEGYIERDQIVAAPDIATRAAGLRTASSAEL